jgi:hypothetical protein
MGLGWTAGKDRVKAPQEGDFPGANALLLWLSSGSLLFAAVEAICLFLVSASGLAVALGGSAIVLVPGALFFHSAAIRLPILGVASVIAMFNLWLLLNQRRLRRAPAAQWRTRPFTRNERRRILLITIMSVLSLILVAAELYLHHKLHGSAFADSSRQLVRGGVHIFLV